MIFVHFSVGVPVGYGPAGQGDSNVFVSYGDTAAAVDTILDDPCFTGGDYYAAQKVLEAYLDTVGGDHISVFPPGCGFLPFCLAGMTGGQQFSGVGSIGRDARGVICSACGGIYRVPPSSVIVMSSRGKPLPDGPGAVRMGRRELGLDPSSVGVEGSRTEGVLRWDAIPVPPADAPPVPAVPRGTGCRRGCWTRTA